MKKLSGIILFCLLLFAVYIDLTKGTLPSRFIQEETSVTDHEIPYIETRTNPGDTLLSLIEQQGGFPDNVPVDTMVRDFIYLNGIKPEKMVPGEIYKIPVYGQHTYLNDAR